jgi:hypothetical protein
VSPLGFFSVRVVSPLGFFLTLSLSFSHTHLPAAVRRACVTDEARQTLVEFLCGPLCQVTFVFRLVLFCGALRFVSRRFGTALLGV